SVVGQDPTGGEAHSHKDPEKVADDTNLPLPDKEYLPELIESKSSNNDIDNEDGASGHEILEELSPDDSFPGESGYEDYEIENIVKLKQGGPLSGLSDDQWIRDVKLMNPQGKKPQESEEWSKSHGQREFPGEGKQDQFGNGILA
ncbi:hypothetical protein P5673_003610, partial [Acropora cervicornis]